MKEIRFFIPGIPAPGGSKNGFAIKKGGVYTGRVAIVDAGGKRTKDWRGAVSVAAMQAMRVADLAPFEGPIETEMIFHMPRPKSHFRSDGVTLRPGSPLRHVFKPDCLKLARSTEDSLTGRCFRDDCQVIKQSQEKFYSDSPGAWVVVREAGQ